MSFGEFVRVLSDNWHIALFGVFSLLLYYYYTGTFEHFREKGVAFSKPHLIVGNIAARLFMKISFHDFVIFLYNKFDGLPYAGFFEGRRPILMIRKPELIKLVLVRDFDHFTNRSTVMQGGRTYINRMLITLKDNEWKAVRSVLTPTFSTSKLKNMVPTISSCASQIVKTLESRADGDYSIEAKKFMGCYTLDIIGCCAFGIECESLKDPNSHFVTIAEKFNDISVFKRALVFLILLFMPELFKYIPITIMNTDATDKLVSMLQDTKKLREKSEEYRKNDFFQLLLDAAHKEVEENSKDPEKKICLDDTTVDAQVLLFLIAGFETSSTILSFTAYELAKHPNIQDKIRSEIKSIISKFGGITYEALSEMTYMDMVISETLRRYPPVARLDRTCTKPYQFPNTELKLQPRDIITIPVSGLHMDPMYYPRPMEFNPERFTAEEKKNRPPHVYLPFGDGPRNCIGIRFALLSIKMAITHLLLKFELDTNDKTQTEVVFSKVHFLLKAENGIWIDVKPLKV